MLKNFWYAIEIASLVTDKPRKLTVLGMDLVVYRKPDGGVAVLSNLCPHRGGSLADGWTDGECVRCPYHGWAFRPDGTCAEIPANTKGLPIPKKAQIDSYPCFERYGFVWAFLGDLPEAERPPPPVFPEFEEPGWRAIYGEFTWNAHYSRVTENAIDIAHTPFVHAKSFGNRDKPQIEQYDVEGDDWSAFATVHLEPPTPKGLWKLIRRKRTLVKATTGVMMPNITALKLDLGKWKTVVYDSNVPVDEKTTRTLYVQLRNFFTGAWADSDARRRMKKIFLEDQRTVEAQKPELLPYDIGAELHLKSDATAVAYRRLRRKFLDMGWGIDSHKIRSELTGRSAVVIPSPARRTNPELARAWVMPEAPVLQLRRKPASENDLS
jgi:phenylpropionate dioxygenase-like ring-hydroxylating dioxygenase large terminal subunit